ncbi:MAG: hypothetical protein ABSC13_03225 [Dehalococcoidia bacterium]|jgi:Tol biopolymer transport system component
MRLVLVLLLAVTAAGCGSTSSRQPSTPTAATTPLIGAGVQFPLVVDGDRLGVSSLDGNLPDAVSGPGYIDGAAYDGQGRLVYVDHAGQQPGFYRVENGSSQLVIPMPRVDPNLPANWSPDGTEAAWIEPDGDTYKLALARPGEDPRYVQQEGIKAFLWSPDGRQILAWDDNWNATAVYVVDFDTGEATSSTLTGLPLAWSPTGNVIVWEQIAGELSYIRAVVVAHPDGSESRILGDIMLATEGSPPDFFSLSTDGRWLAWSRDVNEETRDAGLIVVATDGSATISPKCGDACSANSTGFSPAWSPDGKQIAWAQDGHILVADAGIWQGRVVAEGAVPSWSPDGSVISYVHREGESNTLFALSLATGVETKVVDLTLFSGPSVPIAWSPDSRQVAVPLQAADSNELFSLDLQTGDLQRLPVDLGTDPSVSLVPNATGAVIYDYKSSSWILKRLDGSSWTIPCKGPFAWSPDGKGLLCSGAASLQAIDVASGDVKALAQGGASSARWSPDESAVAFAPGIRSSLSVMNLASGAVTVLIANPESNPAGGGYGSDSYAWSPDSKWIAFTNWRAINNSANLGASTISIIGADGTNLHQLSDSPGFKRDLAFSPDGRYLAYWDQENGLTVLDVTTGRNMNLPATRGWSAIWPSNSSLVAGDSTGISIMDVDGSERLILAYAAGCSQRPIGWSDGKLFFTNYCSHQGE